MKPLSVAIVVVFLSLVCLTITADTWALTGVASKVTQISNGTLVRISGRHAPNSEFIVVDQSQAVVAAALDDGSGLFDFTFRAEPNQLNNLYLFAVDQASQTNPVPITAINQTNILLPPSLAEDPNVPRLNNSLGIGGYTYPGATLTISMANLSGGVPQNSTLMADSQGAWQLQYANLSPGTYTITAESRLDNMISSSSIPLTVTVVADSLLIQAIPSPVGKVADAVGNVVKDVVVNVLPEPVNRAVQVVAPQAKQVAETVTPVASASLLTQLLLSGRDLLYILIQAGISGLQYFGFWRKKHPWGVVYDALTKQPIMLATVRLYAMPLGGTTRRLVETDVSSKAGVFSFEPDPGDYQIEVSKPGYTFPSQVIKGQFDGEYAHVYHGQRVRLEQQLSLVGLSIPLDPEGVHNLTPRQKLIQFIRQRLYLFTIGMLVVGFCMSLIAVIGGAGGINIILVMFYLVVLFAQWYTYSRKNKSWGVVTDEKGRPVEGVQLNLLDPKFNKLVQRRVTTQEGKYQFVVPEGKYVIEIENVDLELVKGIKKTYQGQELWVEGNKPKLIALKIVVSNNTTK